MAARGRSTDYMYAEVDDAALLRRLRALPKELRSELRKDNLLNARRLAGELMGSAGHSGMPPQTALVAKAVYPKQDRLIRVDVGGPKRVGWKYAGSATGRKQYRPSGGARAGELVYGAEFGSKHPSNRYKLRHRAQGYWLGPAMEQWAPELLRIWRTRIAQYLDKVGAS